MLPVAVHAGAALPAGVEDVEDEAPATPFVEVADGDALVHPLTTTSKLAAASVAANRWVVPFN
jgi:hypothetical protein